MTTPGPGRGGGRPDLPGRVTSLLAPSATARRVAGRRVLTGPVASSGNPPVLLLHGLGVPAALCWGGILGRDPVATAALEDWTLVAPDLPGHGPGPAGPAHVEAAATHAAAVLEDLVPGGPAVVVGYSYGGLVAQALAAGWPRRVGHLVLMATAGRLRLGPVSAASYGWTARLARVAGHLPEGAVVRVARRRVGFTDPGLVAAAVAEVASSRPAGLRQAARSMSRTPAARFIPRIRCPVTVVVTTADRRVRPRAQLRLGEDHAASGRSVRTLECHAGHPDVVWAPRRVAPALREALGPLP